MLTPVELAGAGLLALIAYVFGWSAGRSSGKVDAIEATQDIDLSGNGGEPDGGRRN